MTALKNVKNKEIVPFPMDWNRLPAMDPSGMNKIKKHKMRNASTTLEAKMEPSAEYENMNDNGSAKTKKNMQMMIDEIKPNLRL